MKFIILALICSSFAQANPYGYLSAQDQKYYKNDSMEGNNQFERIDLNVKEINKLHGELASLKSEVQGLKKEIEQLKKK